jgi:hypothetical protein
VYGTLLWMGEQRGNRTYALSGTAWALWYVSAANTGLNYIHHTYHLPQDHGLKWLGFAVSMTELVVLAKTLSDLRHPGDKSVVGTLLSATKGWTLFVLVTAITISIPPINALVHGTYAVAGHAMAGMVGIDTMAMLAVMVYLLGPPSVVGLRRWVWATNVGLFGFVGWLHAAGTVDGVTRYLAGGLGDFSHRPAWLAASLAPVLLFAGTASFLGFVGILSHLLPAAFGARLAPPSRARAEASARESRSAPLSGKRAVVGPAQALGQAMVCGGDPALRDQQAGELEELGRQRE